MNILIIDDDIIILNLLKQIILKTFNLYTVHTSLNSKDSITLYIKTKYDIVFIDYNFKNDINGDELYHILIKYYPAIFICMTGMIYDDHPFDDIIFKPFLVKTLIDLIYKYAKTISEKN